MYYTSFYESPLGRLTLAGREDSIAGLWIEGQKYFCNTVDEETVERDELPVFLALRSWLDRYFAGEKPDISEIPLAPKGSNFRQTIWKILCEIPYGEVTTYGEIAKKAAVTLGQKSMSAQAVGGAVSHNPVSVIIPCHRVVGTNGSLTGYAGGIDKKIWLLEHEGADVSRFFVPEGTVR